MEINQLMGGPTVANLLYTFVELDLPGHLAAGPATAADLATATGADPDALRRILRGLAAFGVVAPTGDRHLLTPFGARLRRGTPAADAVALMGHPATQLAWASLPHTARTGERAFDHAHGTDFFSYLMAHADYADRFNRFMSGVTGRVAGLVADGYDFGPAKTVVDVGGGAGALLRAVLRAHPHMTGTVADIAALRGLAETAIAADGLADRCAFVEADFFAAVPAGADAYLLKSVLHDWDDERAVAILATVRAAMGPHSRLLIVERAMPDTGPAPMDDVMSDLTMLAMAPGRERTLAGYTALLAAAGLRLENATGLDGGPTVLAATYADRPEAQPAGMS
jgi:hypothetical protein